MTPKQLLEIKPGITVGNMLTFALYIVTLAVFVAYMRADINIQREMIGKNANGLVDHSEAMHRISDKQIELVARLSAAEGAVAKNSQLAERLKGIETSLEFIAVNIRELKEASREGR